jgi:hypothetical protein
MKITWTMGQFVRHASSGLLDRADWLLELIPAFRSDAATQA